jgi:hypothetical protein
VYRSVRGPRHQRYRARRSSSNPCRNIGPSVATVRTTRPAIARSSGTGRCSRGFPPGHTPPRPSIGSHDQTSASAEHAVTRQRPRIQIYEVTITRQGRLKSLPRATIGAPSPDGWAWEGCRGHPRRHATDRCAHPTYTLRLICRGYIYGRAIAFARGPPGILSQRDYYREYARSASAMNSQTAPSSQRCCGTD